MRRDCAVCHRGGVDRCSVIVLPRDRVLVDRAAVRRCVRRISGDRRDHGIPAVKRICILRVGCPCWFFPFVNGCIAIGKEFIRIKDRAVIIDPGCRVAAAGPRSGQDNVTLLSRRNLRYFFIVQIPALKDFAVHGCRLQNKADTCRIAGGVRVGRTDHSLIRDRIQLSVHKCVVGEMSYAYVDVSGCTVIPVRVRNRKRRALAWRHENAVMIGKHIR